MAKMRQMQILLRRIPVLIGEVPPTAGRKHRLTIGV